MSYNFAGLASEYRANWRAMVIADQRRSEFEMIVRRIRAGRASYEAVEQLTGVPAAVIGVIHEREGAGNFTTHLHNGDPLRARTVHVPAGRPLDGAPPFTWTESAVDALRYEGLAGRRNWTVEFACFALERYNGFGYRNRGLRSPYVWGGTNLQQPGKYVADGRFDAAAMDRQPGAAALLMVLFATTPEWALPFEGEAVAVPQRPPAPEIAIDPAPIPPPRPRLRPEPPPAPMPGAFIAALVAALGGALIAFRDQVVEFLHHLFN